MKGLGAILVELKKPLALEEIEMPPLVLGQVLVRVICCGICGSQIGEINGVKGPDKYLPHLLGHEGTGEVLEVGQGVRRVKPGDRVVLHWRKAAGLESIAPVYQSAIGKINAGWVTAFNELRHHFRKPPHADPQRFRSRYRLAFRMRRHNRLRRHQQQRTIKNRPIHRRLRRRRHRPEYHPGRGNGGGSPHHRGRSFPKSPRPSQKTRRNPLNRFHKIRRRSRNPQARRPRRRRCRGRQYRQREGDRISLPPHQQPRPHRARRCSPQGQRRVNLHPASAF